MPDISIPYQWEPRPHQIPFFKAMDSGAKRACIVWHRRAGKGAATLMRPVKDDVLALQRVSSAVNSNRATGSELWNVIENEVDQAE